MNLKKIISGLMGICLAITFSSNVKAETNESKDIKDLPQIKEYQNIIDKINLELGSEISIPDNETIDKASLDRTEIYNNIVNQSLDEFEDNLRKDYENFDNGTYESSEMIEEGKRIEIPIEKASNEIQPFSIREPLTQVEYLFDPNTGKNEGAVDLKSEVFSSTGRVGTFVYSSIYSLGYYEYTDRTHFRATSSTSYTLSSDKKNCTAKYTGSYFTATGLQLAGVRTYTITYNAG